MSLQEVMAAEDVKCCAIPFLPSHQMSPILPRSHRKTGRNTASYSERTCIHESVVTVDCHRCSISLLVPLISCLIHKLAFIMYMEVKQTVYLLFGTILRFLSLTKHHRRYRYRGYNEQ